MPPPLASPCHAGDRRSTPSVTPGWCSPADWCRRRPSRTAGWRDRRPARRAVRFRRRGAQSAEPESPLAANTDLPSAGRLHEQCVLGLVQRRGVRLAGAPRSRDDVHRGVVDHRRVVVDQVLVRVRRLVHLDSRLWSQADHLLDVERGLAGSRCRVLLKPSTVDVAAPTCSSRSTIWYAAMSEVSVRLELEDRDRLPRALVTGLIQRREVVRGRDLVGGVAERAGCRCMAAARRWRRPLLRAVRPRTHAARMRARAVAGY